MPKVKFTENRVREKMTARGQKRTRYYCTSITGWGLQAYPGGVKSWFIEYYTPSGEKKRRSYGRFPETSFDAAQEQAVAALRKARAGEDPFPPAPEPEKPLTLGEWISQYLKEVERTKRRPEVDRGYLAPLAEEWDDRPLESLTPDDIEDAMRWQRERTRASLEARVALSEAHAKKLGQDPAAAAPKLRQLLASGDAGKTTVNRFYAALSACLQRAWMLGRISENPARRVRKARESEPRTRVLSLEERQQLLSALDKEVDQHASAAVRLLLNLGLRLREALNLQWDDVDLQKKVLTLRLPKSGKRQQVPIDASSAEMLLALPRDGEYVFTGRNPTKPRYDLKGPWRRISEAAGLDDVSLHDLRRDCGLRVANTCGLLAAAKVLRHQDMRTTERVYSPWSLQAMRDAIDKTAEADREALAELRKKREAKEAAESKVVAFPAAEKEK